MIETLDDLKELIIEWARNKGIDGPDNIERQFLKLTEEVGELSGAISRGNVEDRDDALGDIFVVWTILCHKCGVSPNKVARDVYDIISKRTGKTVDGVFIKDGE